VCVSVCVRECVCLFLYMLESKSVRGSARENERTIDRERKAATVSNKLFKEQGRARQSENKSERARTEIERERSREGES